MNTRKVSLWLLLSGLFVLLLLVFPWRSNAAGTDTAEEVSFDSAALKLASEKSGTPVDQLKIHASAQASYQYAGQVTYDYKIYSPVTDQVYLISLDQKGNPVDQEALLAADAAAYTMKYGKIDPDLAELSTQFAADSVVPVIIALVEPEGAIAARVSPDREMSEEEYATFRANALAQVQWAVSTVVVPFQDYLDGLGYESVSAEVVPYVFTQVKLGDLAVIAAQPEVRSIGLDVMAENQVDFAWYRTGYDQVYARRIVGRAKLGVVEVGHGTLPANPYLRYVYSDTSYRCASPSGHEVGVLGIIYSSHTSKTGLAMGAQIWSGGSCGGYSSELANRESAAVSWGADGINNSWGTTYAYTSRNLSTTFEGFYDDLWRNTSTTVVFAAGNYGDDPAPKTGWLSNPAGAYNILTVGAETKNSPATIAAYSSYIDPLTLHNDMEKPEVTAPGSSMNSTLTASPWIGSIGSGTSFAAPIVTSMVATAGQRSTWLLSWPETMKAAIMVSALRNIEAGTIWSDRDGQGGIHFGYADDVFRVISTTGRSGMGYTCGAAYQTTLVTVYIPAYKRIRFAISYDTYSAYANYTTRPSADLDLAVYNASGTWVAGSSSFDNTYEILDWTPTTSGNYTFKVNKASCAGDPNYLGWAYWRQP